MPDRNSRRSPNGRPIHIHHSQPQAVPPWIARRRRAYRLVDALASAAKHAVRRWLAPRPRGAARRGGRFGPDPQAS